MQRYSIYIYFIIFSNTENPTPHTTNPTTSPSGKKKKGKNNKNVVANATNNTTKQSSNPTTPQNVGSKKNKNKNAANVPEKVNNDNSSPKSAQSKADVVLPNQNQKKKKKKNKKNKGDQQGANQQIQAINKNEDKITEQVAVTAVKKLKKKFNKKKKQIGQINPNKAKIAAKGQAAGQKNKNK